MSASRAALVGRTGGRIGSVRAAPYAGAVPVARRRDPHRSGPPCAARSTGSLAETYPDASCELDFDDPFQLLVVTVLSAQTTDKRVNAVRPTLFAAYPDARAMAAADRADARGDRRAARLLPGQDRVAAQAQRRPGRGPRRRGAAPARRPGQAARRRPQDRQRRARQRLRRPRHHRRHPLRPARPPVRLDRGDRPGQGRARGRRALPEARLDDAQPPPDLARPPRLPRAEARVRRLPGRALVPVVRRGPDRPGRRRPSWSRPRAAHEAGRSRPRWSRPLLVLPARGGCGSDDVPAPGRGARSTSTPRQLRALKADAGIEDCVPGTADRSTAASRTSRCPASAAARTSTSPASRARWSSTCGQSCCGPCRKEMPALAGVPRAVRRPGRRSSASTHQDLQPQAALELAKKVGVTYPLLADPGGDLSGEAAVPGHPMAIPYLAFVDADGDGRLSAVRRGRRRTTSWSTWSSSTSGSACDARTGGAARLAAAGRAGGPRDRGRRPDPLRARRRAATRAAAPC